MLGLGGDDLVPWGSRVPFFYSTLDELCAGLSRYFAAGLAAGERCRFVGADASVNAAIRASLRALLVDFEAHEAAGLIGVVRELDRLDGPSRVAVDAASLVSLPTDDALVVLRCYDLHRCENDRLIELISDCGVGVVAGGPQLRVIHSASELIAATRVTRAKPAPSHAVTFYGDWYPAEAIADFLAAGFRAGAPIACIARADHAVTITAALGDRGVPADALAVLDATALLDQHQDDTAALAAAIVEFLDNQPAGERPLRVFGEIVELLAASDHVLAAFEIERWWNEVIEERGLELLCAYNLETLATGDLDGCLEICGLHSDIDLDLDSDDKALLVRAMVRSLSDERAIDVERVAHLEAERAATARLVKLQQVTLALSETRDYAGVNDVLERVVAPALGARQAAIAGKSIDAPRWLADRSAVRSHRVGSGAAQAVAQLPLRIGGSVIGVLEIEFDSPRPFDATSRALICDVAKQVAIAVDRMHLLARASARAAEAEASRRQFHEVVAHAPIPLVVLDDANKIVAASSAWESVFGYRRSDLGVHLDDLAARLYRDRAHELMEQIARLWNDELPLLRVEHAVWNRAGDLRIAQLSSSPLRALPGRRRLMACTFADITEQKNVAQRHREANEHKNRFLAMIGHELRNPLAAIRSAGELLKMTETSPDIARVCSTLERQTAHMARMIDDLLDVSAIIRNQLAIDRAPVDLAELIRAEAAELRASVEAAGLRLAVDVGPGRFTLNGDEVRLAHVIESLIGNSIKFTEPPGWITIAARRDDDQLRLVIADTGAGIDQELLPRIFEPGSQADQELARTAGGLGLGLAVVKGIVERHGGRVTAESPGPGQGATFTITLPASDRAAETGSVCLPVRARGSERVLVVEDNVDAAELLCSVLGCAGHQVEMAHDGELAIEAVRRHRPDVVICDIGLPGQLSGYDVAAAVRAEPAYSDTYLIALSGYDRPGDIQRAHEAGFDVHLSKPANLAAIEEALAGRWRR